jgi:anaerobic selenocysteine-containing dehydrogenase
VKRALQVGCLDGGEKIVVAPELCQDELSRFLAELFDPRSPKTKDGLVLIGRRHVRSNNSWLHNSQRLMKGPTRHELLMHPEDALARGLSSGTRVRITSRTGHVTVDMRTTDQIMRGVVSLPHGFGHDRQGTRLPVASAHPGVSNNDLTDEIALDVSGNAALNGIPVSVEAST